MTKSEKARPDKPDPPLLFVDAVEADTARLVAAGGVAFTLPVRWLPPGAKEGSWLRASFVLADPPPDDGAQIRARLGRGDDGGDIKL
ncbi:MAG TPA: hypothetical protein VHM31_01490 [Polyangia bacterium]|nr:hypothetical protein [Polyangia bacterium]